MYHVNRSLRELLWGLVAVLLCLNSPMTTAKNDCDRNYYSRTGPKNATFTSPNFPNNYDENSQCTYKFVGLPHERVRIVFREFQVKGVPPRCIHDYVDMYTQVRNVDEDVLEVPLHGRYCGSQLEALPHQLITMNNIFVLIFYSDKDKQAKGFLASYEFIDGSIYTVGTPAPPNVCGQTIRGEVLPEGEIRSPTYPGMYPDNIFCYYKLQGAPGQRIRLTFIDLDLYSGGAHCPFDYVRIFDGPTNEALLIDTYCGRMKNVSIYSTKEFMHIEFETKSGRVEPTKKPYLQYWEVEEETKAKRQGFLASFEISNRFVKLDFIKVGIHVIGTECDQRVCSSGETNGTVTSPGYPRNYPLNIVCHYFIDGLVDKQNLEKAELTFDMFQIPSAKQSCDNGYLSAYVHGQDLGGKNLVEDADYRFCGETLPPPLTTTNPRLFLIFDSRLSRNSGRGFRAHYQFVTDYDIPGTPVPDSSSCHFLYYSSSKRDGTFNTPRHPSNYPHEMDCTYEFIGEKHQQVRITFDNFVTEDRDKNCTNDFVKVYSMKPSPGHRDSEQSMLVGQYCDEQIPGPIVSDADVHKMRVYFHSDNTQVRQGFRAKYEFIGRKTLSEQCFENITAGGVNGVSGGRIMSPNKPLKYQKNITCEWYIYSKDKQILLEFEEFSLEGNINGGCPTAVLKIYTKNTHLPVYELCGKEMEKLPYVLSENHFIKLKFMTSSRSNGGKGFTIAWTEIKPQTRGYEGSCDGFQCVRSGFCISNSQRCDRVPNCGADDKSDETDCGPSYSNHQALHIILGVVVSLVVLVFMIVCILHRRRKSRKRKNKKEIEVRYVTRGSTPNRTGPASDKLLKERTEKVSIV